MTSDVRFRSKAVVGSVAGHRTGEVGNGSSGGISEAVESGERVDGNGETVLKEERRTWERAAASVSACDNAESISAFTRSAAVA